MATIRRQGITGDGYDVDCLLASGESVVFHFLTQPAEVQAQVNAMEAAREAATIVYDLTGED